MTNTDNLKKEFYKDVMGFNDRGIVEYDEANKFACCLNCNKTLKGPLAKEWIFGHKGCEKPNGAYIPNDMTPDKLWTFIDTAINKAVEETIDGIYFDMQGRWDKKTEHELAVLLRIHRDELKSQKTK